MTDTPTTFGATALPLFERGWRPVPLVAATKRPAEPGWNRLNREQWTPEDLRLACMNHVDAACGLALPSTNLAVDLDIIDADAAQEVREIADRCLGMTQLVRIGRAPKSLLLYRSEGVRSSKPHPIELFAGTGQVAAFGIHSTTGKPYTWPSASPLEVAADSKELPMVTDRALQRFLAEARPVMARLRQQARSGGANAAGMGEDAGDRLRGFLGRGMPFHRAAARVLQGADEGGRHAAVLAVISAGYNRGMEPVQLMRLIERSAPLALLDHVGTYLYRTLHDFEPKNPGAWDGR